MIFIIHELIPEGQDDNIMYANLLYEEDLLSSDIASDENTYLYTMCYVISHNPKNNAMIFLRVM